VPTSKASTTTPVAYAYSVAALGLHPGVSLTNSGALGSGCVPGPGSLPDGAWFGWVNAASDASLEFDLACIWPGRIEPAVSNESSTLRTLATTDAARVYRVDGSTISYADWLGQGVDSVGNAPGLPSATPFWLFVNDDAITELAVYPRTVDWAIADAWPVGLVPQCCDMGDLVPSASPTGTWPARGWPSDGFYDVEIAPDAATADLVIRRYQKCADHPGLCPDWWVGEEGYVDREQEVMERTISLDEDLTVVIAPVLGENELVGDGAAYAELRADIDQAVEALVPKDEDEYESFEERLSDPEFPFGFSDPELGYLIIYRGPAGRQLTYGQWWAALEIKDGEPIIYLHAGLIAG
jgi:hypothetical protein